MGSRKATKQGETEGIKALGSLLSPCPLRTPHSGFNAPNSLNLPSARSQVTGEGQAPGLTCLLTLGRL